MAQPFKFGLQAKMSKLNLQEVNFTQNVEGNPFAFPAESIPYSTITTKVVEDKANVLWKIEGLSDDAKWQAIIAQAKCEMKIGNPPKKLCFFIESEHDGTPAPVNRSVVNRSNIKSVSEYTALFCKTESQEDVVVKLGIDKINPDKTTTVILSPTIKTLKRKIGRGVGGTSFQCCILTGEETQAMGLFPALGDGTVVTWPTTVYPIRRQSLGDKDSIRIHISATMYSCKEIHDGLLSENEVALASLAKDLGAIYGDGSGSSFYPDLMIESKDGILLKANRIIVAARSPQLKARLEEMKTEEGEAVAQLKIPDMDAQPLRAILHWMYTGELSLLENSKMMEDVIKGAGVMQLSPLMEILEKNLIATCDKDNMVDLYQLAKVNGFPKAMKEIAQFMKENL